MEPTILYLSHEPDLQLLLGNSDASVRPRVVVDVDPADTLARVEASEIDCVVTENRLYDNRDGTPFVERVRDVAPEIPLVVYASAGPASNEQVLLDAGATAFHWHTPDPTERCRIRDEILELAQRSKQSHTNRIQRAELEQFLQLSDDAFALHDFVTGRDLSYPGLEGLAPTGESTFTIDDAFEMIHEADRVSVLEKNDAVLSKDPSVFDSLDDEFGTFSEEVRVTKTDGNIAHCLMRGAAVFDGDRLVKMYNSLTDVTREFEFEWKSRSEAVLLESESDRVAAQEVCQNLVEETDSSAAWVTRLSLSQHASTEHVFAADGEYDPFVGASTVSSAFETLNERIITDRSWDSDTTSTGPVSGIDPRPVYTEPVDHPKPATLVSTPVFRGGVLYGTVTAVLPIPVTDTFKELLGTLASSLAYRHEVEGHRRALHADELTEVTVRVDADHFLLDFYDRYGHDDPPELDARELDMTSEGLRQFLISARRPTSDEHTLVATFESLEAVDQVSVTTATDDAVTLLVTVGGESLNTLLTPHACIVRRFHATPHAVVITIDAPPRTNVRRVIDTVRDRYPKTRFGSRIRADRTAGTPSHVEALTPKQDEALRVATLMGFFDRPQRATADDVATVLDVSRSTALHHIRNAEQRIFSKLR